MNELTNTQTFQPGPDDPKFIAMVRKMTSDMKFVGTFTIIYGVLMCLGIITAIIGVPYIFAGIRMNEAAEMFKTYLFNNDFVALANALERQGRALNIMKILIIVGLVFIALYIIAIIVLLTSGVLGNLPRSLD